jgi:hypothetical protein
MSSSEEALRASIAWWGAIADWSLLVVLVGAVLAFVAEFLRSQANDRWMRRVTRMSSALVVVGTAIGLDAQHRLGAENATLVATIQNATGLALQKAAELGVTTNSLAEFTHSKTQEANDTIAALQEALARASNTLSAMQEQQVPRQLTDAQRDVIKKTIRGSVRVYVNSQQLLPEPQDFADKIIGVLDGIHDVEVRGSPVDLHGSKLLISYDHHSAAGRTVAEALQKASLNPVEYPWTPPIQGEIVIVSVGPRAQVK